MPDDHEWLPGTCGNEVSVAWCITVIAGDLLSTVATGHWPVWLLAPVLSACSFATKHADAQLRSMPDKCAVTLDDELPIKTKRANLLWSRRAGAGPNEARPCIQSLHLTAGGT